MTLAIAQPLLGIPLLLGTRLYGRSGLMGGGGLSKAYRVAGSLVLSILMLADGVWTVTGLLGVTASLLLLVGDFGTTGRSSRPLAALLAVGYGALVAWFGWVAVRLVG